MSQAGVDSAQESKGTIRVVQLYPRDMNIYGDWGNALVLQQRTKWHGYTPELLVRTKLPAKTEQRLRDIVAYAQRDGAKPGTIDLLMTALSRIVAQ